jgi:hypothetical protein
MKIIVVGPNIAQAGTTGFHIHAEGCRDLRQPKYADAPKERMDVETVEAVTRDVYQDHINEAGNPDDISVYVNDFTILPCAAALR